MKKINIENSSDDAIKHVLKTFSKLTSFFPDNNNISIDDILSPDFKFDEKTKKDSVSFIYQTTKNLIKYHLSDISKKINEHPEKGNNVKETFEKEKNFLNSLYSPATTMKSDNFFFFNKDKIILDKNNFIDEKLFLKVEEDLQSLFKKQLSLFKNHVIFDVMIYQIDNMVDDTYFIKNEGLKFIEDKNFLKNEKNITEKYVENIFKSLDFFNFNDEEKIKTIDSFEKLFNESYFKSNREEILTSIKDHKSDLLSLPNMLEKYEEFSENKNIEKFNWDRFFSYANEEQLLSALKIFSQTESFKNDIEKMKKSENYDIFSELKDSNSLIGNAFKHLFEQKKESNKNNILGTIDLIERFFNEELESSEKLKVEEKKKAKPRSSRTLKS